MKPTTCTRCGAYLEFTLERFRDIGGSTKCGVDEDSPTHMPRERRLWAGQRVSS